ncbi:MAG: NADH-quinone oxidoreductase subunit M [Phycisphaera sp.]|nr:NADH-quinone oxidoreductase subunit M [Phycisphaera sp.]
MGMTTYMLASSDGSSLLALMVLLPIIAGLAPVLAPMIVSALGLKVSVPRGGAVRSIAFWSSVATFVLSLLVMAGFNWDHPDQLFAVYSVPWIGALGIHFSLGIDSISLWLILLTTLLTPVTILGTWNDAKFRTVEFYLWLLVLEGALIGVFAARDLVLFYVFFELTLVPLFFLIGIFGSTRRRYAAVKFFLFTLVGSVFTFAGVLYAAWFAAQSTGVWSFDINHIVTEGAKMPAATQGWVLLAMMCGFAVKVPLFPVHTWLPLAHTEAPTAGSAILAGVLLKLGTYGLLRFVVPLVPTAAIDYAPVIGVLCVIGILYTALICWNQRDVKKLVAYSSVSHMGFCVLGMFALNAEGVGGSVMYMINHGLSTGALFLCIGMIYNRYHTRQMADIGGLGRRMPIWGFFMVFFCMASVGLPGLNGFVGEFLTLLGAFVGKGVYGTRYIALWAALGLILGAIYILYMVGKVVIGPLREPADAHDVSDLNWREITALTPLAVACLVLGLYPAPVLNSIEAPIDNTLAPTKLVLAERKHAKPHAPKVAMRDEAGAVAADDRIDSVTLTEVSQ